MTSAAGTERKHFSVTKTSSNVLHSLIQMVTYPVRNNCQQNTERTAIVGIILTLRRFEIHAALQGRSFSPEGSL